MYLFSYLTVKWAWILLASEGALFQRNMVLQNIHIYVFFVLEMMTSELDFFLFLFY